MKWNFILFFTYLYIFSGPLPSQSLICCTETSAYDSSFSNNNKKNKNWQLYNAKSGIFLCIEHVYPCCSQCSWESLISSLLSVFCLCEQKLPHEPLSFSPLCLSFFPTLSLSFSFQLSFVSLCPHSPNVLAKHLSFLFLNYAF